MCELFAMSLKDYSDAEQQHVIYWSTGRETQNEQYHSTLKQ